MGRYIVRSVKYLAGLLALVTVLYGVMYALHMLPVTPWEALRGEWKLLVVLVVLAGAYPRFGFVSRTLEGSVERDRDTIVRVFDSAGFRLAGEERGRLTFRARGITKQVLCLGEDEITVSDDGQGTLTLEGIRREAVNIEFRLRSYLRRRDEE